MRENWVSYENYTHYIDESTQILEESRSDIAAGNIAPERIADVQRYNYSNEIRVFIARYSRGDDIAPLIPEYKRLVFELHKYFTHEWYEEMLRLLSIGIMLEIEDACIFELAGLLKREGIDNWIFNFLLHSRDASISYENSSFTVYPDFYQSLRELVNSSPAEQPKLLKAYLSKWYPAMKTASWYNSHKNKWIIHYGYWSFESGAIAKLLSLNDSGFQSVKYYPYDLVHYAD
ncbi:MAG: DUF1911 domain-containing protein [Oscillospiraceae bacterium]|jgi:hypothetical protein|nr:DUF1911 domain-containing protein [Oscillospiraceae bacterium]